MDSRPVKGWTILGLVCGLACGLVVVLIFRGSPIELLRIAQGFAIVAFPLLGYLVLSIAGDREVMGNTPTGGACISSRPSDVSRSSPS